MIKNDERWAERMQAFMVWLDGMAKGGAHFGMTGEETQAHLDAFKEAAMDPDAFLDGVARDQEEYGPRTQTAQRQYDARRNVAVVIDEWFSREALEGYDGLKH